MGAMKTNAPEGRCWRRHGRARRRSINLDDPGIGLRRQWPPRGFTYADLRSIPDDTVKRRADRYITLHLTGSMRR